MFNSHFATSEVKTHAPNTSLLINLLEILKDDFISNGATKEDISEMKILLNKGGF